MTFVYKIRESTKELPFSDEMKTSYHKKEKPGTYLLNPVGAGFGNLDRFHAVSKIKI